MGRNSGSKKPVLSMDFKSVEAPDNVSIPGQSNDTGYQISETVVTKTKVTHSTKNSKTIFSQNVTKNRHTINGMRSPVNSKNHESPYTTPLVAIDNQMVPKKQVIVRPNKQVT